MRSDRRAELCEELELVIGDGLLADAQFSRRLLVGPAADEQQLDARQSFADGALDAKAGEFSGSGGSSSSSGPSNNAAMGRNTAHDTRTGYGREDLVDG